MKIPYFIDENINILVGAKAVEALKEENDQHYFQNEKGVSKVSKERWIKAQACEKNHWFVRGKKTSNDRNDYHLKHFYQFKNLKNKNFKSVIEIGCGPFTNIRLIAKKCRIENSTLLDPMLNEYLSHPFSSFNRNYIFSEFSTLMGKIVRKVFPPAYKHYLSLFSNKTRIIKLLNLPAEEIPTNESYELVIMINVIEHCYDAELVFQNILEITKNGSYFIFEDKLLENSDIKNALANSYDAAHPLKVDKNLIRHFLEANFTTIYEKTQTTSAIFGGEEHLSEDLYFIGMRK